MDGCRCEKKIPKVFLGRVAAGRLTTGKTVCLYFLSSRIMALEEDRSSGNWREKRVCMGDKKTCSFHGLINHHHKFIISFAEDEAGFLFSFFLLIFCLCIALISFTLAEQNLFFFLPGELYFLATAYPSTSSPFGTIFKIVDPSRWVPELRRGRATQKES